MIRIATHEDIPEAVDLCRAFHAYSPWAFVPFDADDMAGLLGRLVDHGIVLLSDEGICAGLLNPLYFNSAYVVAAELLWWAPAEGGALRLAFEGWGKAQGAQAVQFSGLGDDHAPAIARLFGRAGYRPVETAFFKEF